MSKQNKGLIETATEVVEQVADQVTPVLESAVETARKKLAEGIEQATPVVESAMETARKKLAEGVEQATPVVESAVGTAREKLADGAVLLHEGREAATAKLSEVASQPAPKKSGGKLKWILATGALAVVGGAIFKKLKADQGAGDNWQSSYTPPAPVRPVAEADDSAAATPDEALADNAATPHRDTTPDDPAEFVELAEPDELPEPDEINPDPAEGDDRP
ncbi:hypothetical protein ACLM5J_05185 [Nocardioides sp. Bht2]|uniref:hypothetical protein n=1 Tax=Nocardioides sp. Bht2 TaxID=3392297 RepID=UPI0039B57FF1